MPYKITVIRSKRKTVAIEVTPDLQVIVRAPKSLPRRRIDNIINEKSSWIEKAIERLSAAANEPEKAVQRLNEQEKNLLRERTRREVTACAERYARIMDVSYNRISVKAQTTRWGSCSSKGNLNFNLLLTLCPSDVLNYVVVHEMCHLLEPNHSARFWQEVERILPDYKTPRKWLKENSSRLISRIK